MNAHAKSILITGGGGLIGTATCRALKSAGWRVSTLDLHAHDLDGRSIDYLSDLTADTGLGDKLEGIAGIVHLAAVSRVCDAERHPERCSLVNLHGTRRLLKSAVAAGCRWFLFGSSREVYGEQELLPVCETAKLQPINHYGRVKVEGERLVAEKCRAGGMCYAVLRFSNVYGHAGDHPTRLINAFIRQALTGESLEIHGGGQIFDFTYAKDVAQAIVATADYLHRGNDSLPHMHILPGKATGIEEVARLVLEATNSSSAVVFTPRRDYDVNRFYGDAGLMEEKLGLRCKTSLPDGIRLTVQAFTRV